MNISRYNKGIRVLCGVAYIFLLGACAIENDIPYPIVDGSIQALEVEGQCDADGNSSTQATINKTDRTISLYIDDTADLKKLRITKLAVSNDATLIPDSAACNNFSKFPTIGFESLENIPLSSDTRINFYQPVTFTLRTYQERGNICLQEASIRPYSCLIFQFGRSARYGSSRPYSL